MLQKNPLAFSLLSAVALLLSPWCIEESAADNCGLTLITPNVNLSWNIAFTSQPITFTVNRNSNGNGNCDYNVTFSKGGASDYNRRLRNGPAHMRYQLYKEASLVNVLKEWPDTSNNDEILKGYFPHGSRNQTQNLIYYFAIPSTEATSPTLKPAGTYTDSYVMKLYEKNISHPQGPDATSLVTVSVTVPKIIQISLVNSGGAFDANATTQFLNFGNLTTGATRGFDLKILSNAGYNVTFTSQNNGNLAHTNPAVTTTIPYTVRVNGAAHTLSNTPTSVANGSGQTTINGANNPVIFSIGTLPDVVAGSYSDTVTVTATTRE